MNTQRTETTAANVEAWLCARGYGEVDGFTPRAFAFDGMGSVRVLSKGDIFVVLRNDRGDFLVTMARGVRREEETYGVNFWGLCLGVHAVDGDRDLTSWTPEDQELWLAEEGALVQRVIEALDVLPPAQWENLEACVRRRHEAYWRGQGIWPLPPRMSGMRPREPERR